jgi:hypothetical protein
MMDMLLHNILSPAVLFFALGIIAATVKSDLKFPQALSDTLSIYLLIAIGLKGGVELSHFHIADLMLPLLGTLLIGCVTPLVAIWVARKLGFDFANAAALAATYGSVSIVTFGATTAFLQESKINFESFMTAMIVVAESPAICIAVLLYAWSKSRKMKLDGHIIRESLFGKSVLLMVGGLLVGVICGSDAIPVIKPLFIDMYKSVLILFLLGMGIMAGEKLGEVRKVGMKLVLLAIGLPLLFGALGAVVGTWVGLSIGGATIMAIIGASASYIAAPAAVRQSIPDASPSIYLGASLGITFPFNLLIGIPLFTEIAKLLHG